MGISAYGNDMLMPVPDGPYRVDRAENFMPNINHDRAMPGDFTPMPGPVIDFMPGSGISIPGQGFQMQPQQYMQVPYAQQYAQQGNINDPSVYAALEALNAPAYVAQPTQRYGSGIMDQTGGGAKGGSMNSAPMVQDWRIMRDQIAARTPPAVVADAASAGDSSGGFGDSSGGLGNVGQGVSNNAANAGLAMMGYPSMAPYGPVVNAIGYGIAGQQADAMGAAADNLGAIQAANQLGVMSVSDVNGNTFSMVSPQSIAAADAAAFAPTPTESLMDAIAATPGGLDAVNTGMATNAANQSVSNDMTIGAQNADMGGVSTSIGVGDIGQAAETGMTSVNGQSVSNDATIAAQDAATFGTDSSGDGGSSKIVCTAMNNAYGFGSFRNAIWLKYSSQHLTKAHEAGYHALFLPLVDYGFKQGDATPNRLVRKCLEHVARHRSADLRAEMRGMKRDALGRAYRFVLEPLCLVVGKLKGY